MLRGGRRSAGSTHMHRDRVDGARSESLMIPRGKALSKREASRVTGGVVLAQFVASLKLEAGDYHTAREQMRSARSNERRTRFDWAEEGHVASKNHYVKATAERQGCEVRLDPLQFRSAAPGLSDHRGVNIDAYGVDAVASEFDGDTPRPAASVKYRRRVQGSDQRCLTVDVD